VSRDKRDVLPKPLGAGRISDAPPSTQGPGNGGASFRAAAKANDKGNGFVF